MSRTRRAARFACVLLLLAVVPAAGQDLRQLEQQLRTEYKGKALWLRSCYAGSSLSFDVQGNLLHPGRVAGCAANQQVQVDGLKLEPGKMRLDCRRLISYFDTQGILKAIRTHDEVKIEIGMGTALDQAALDAALGKVFHVSNDPLPQPPPAPEQYKSERFEFKPGKPLVVRQKGTSEWKQVTEISEPIDVGVLDDGQPLYIFSGGLKPPTVLKAADPDYPGGFPGVSKDSVLVSTILDNEGFVRTMRLKQPTSSSAERSVLEAVSQWTFKPATWQGKPVAVAFMVEVNFHP